MHLGPSLSGIVQSPDRYRYPPSPSLEELSNWVLFAKVRSLSHCLGYPDCLLVTKLRVSRGVSLTKDLWLQKKYLRGTWVPSTQTDCGYGVQIQCWTGLIDGGLLWRKSILLCCHEDGQATTELNRLRSHVNHKSRSRLQSLN